MKLTEMNTSNSVIGKLQLTLGLSKGSNDTLALTRLARAKLFRLDQLYGRKVCQNCPAWPWTTFATKIGTAGPILAAKTGSFCQFIMLKIMLMRNFCPILYQVGMILCTDAVCHCLLITFSIINIAS